MTNETTSPADTPREGHNPEELFAILYEELKRLANRKRAGWENEYTLNTTAIVHEAYLKLVGGDSGFDNTRHFLCVAGKAMRQVLVDHSRLRLAEKRGGSRQKVSLTESHLDPAGPFMLTVEKAAEIIRLDEALTHLRQRSEREADVVDCRFFAGLGVEETAEALGISRASVGRDWAKARLWLHQYLRDEAGEGHKT